MTYWINTVGADHVQRGVAGGFTQANHGKPDMLRKMARDDWIIFYSYSPKTAFEDGEPLQAAQHGVPALHGDAYPATAQPAAVHR